MKRHQLRIWILVLLSMAGAGTAIGQTTPYTGGYAGTRADDLWNGSTEFFIYNPGRGLWVQPANARHRYNNNTSTTHLSVGETGFTFKMTNKSTSGDDHVKLSPQFTASKEGVRLGWRTDQSMLIFDQTYTNTGHGSDWYFGVGRGDTYILHDNGGLLSNDRIRINTTEGRTYLGIFTRSNSNSTSNDDEEWIFVTEATRRNTMKDYANQGKTFDVSYWMGNYDFRRGYRDDWDANRKRFQEDNDGGNNDWSEAFLSCYVHNVWNSNNFRISQTIGDLPNGHYRFRVQAAYRDGNRADVGARWTNGTENLRAKYYIESVDPTTGIIMGGDFTRKENSVKSILSEAPTSSTSYWNTLCENSGRYVPDNVDDWSRLWGNNTEAYWNDYIDVFVTDHRISLGIYKNGNSGGDWLCMSEFQLLYYEATKAEYQNVLKHYTEAVRPMFERLSTEAKNTWRARLETAEARANGNADGPSVGDYEASINDMRELYNVKDMNTLIRTCILAEAEGAESGPINNAWAFISSVAVDNNNYNEGTYNGHLYNVRSARKLNAAAKVNPDDVTGSAPANGQFYLLNVGSGLFLNTTTHWSTHISIDNPGMLITFVQDGTGTGGLPAFHMSGNGWNGFNWTEEYWDKNGEHKSSFRLVEGTTDTYYWNVFDNARWHFVYDVTDGATDGPKFWNSVQKRERDVNDYKNDPYAMWKLVSPTELKTTLLNNATKGNPVDATAYITNPGFSRTGNTGYTSGWTNPGNVVSRGGGGRDDSDGRYVMEFYQSDVNMSQTLTGLPAGYYTVSVNGFFRDGSTDNETTKKRNGETLKQTAKLIATSNGRQVETLLPNLTSELGKFPGLGQTRAGLTGEMPIECYEAEEYFATGLYRAETEQILVDNGSLTISITNTHDGTAGNWVVIDNFRLTYLYNPQKELQEAVADNFTGNTTTALHTAYNTAKSNAEAVSGSTPVATVIDRAERLREATISARSVDDTELEDYLALAKDEESTMTTGNNRLYAEALDFITNGTTPEGLATALNKIKSVRKVNAMKRFVTPVTEGSTPAAGTYYLYNVGTGLWLCNGSDWGTHAAVDYYGIPVTLTADGTTGGKANYHIITNVNGTGKGFAWERPYCDGNGEAKWHFLPVAGKTNVYNIAIFDKEDDVLAYNPDAATDRFKCWNTVSKEKNVPTSFYNDPNAQWMLVTEAQRNALLSGANPGSLVEANYKIVNPALSNIYPGYTAWANFGTTTGTGPFNWGSQWTWQQTGSGHFAHITSGESTEMLNDKQRRCHNFGMEFYNFQTFRLSQTLTGLQPGTYRVGVQAFYRAGNDDAAAESKAYLFATGTETVTELLPRPKDFVQKNVSVTRTLASGTETTSTDLDYLPGVQNGQRINSPSLALEAFESGMFLTEVEAFVGEDGTLTIGVEQPTNGGSGYGESWVVIDNFRLDYMGPYQPTSVSSIQWAGLGTEASVDFTENGYVRDNTTKAVTGGQHITAYKVVDTSEKYAILEEVTDAAEGTGLLINTAAGTNFVRLKSTTGTNHTDNMLKISDGTITGDYETTTHHRIYVLSNKNGLGFYPVKSTVTIPKGKVYLDDGLSSGSGVKEYMLLGIGDDETGISPISRDTDLQPVFDLSGRKVADRLDSGKLPKGIYTVKGRKMIVK